MTIPSEGPSHIRSKVLESSKVAKLESSKVANPSAKLSLHCKTKLNACVVTMKMLLLLRLSILVLAGVASVGGDDADPPRLAAVADAEDVADRGAARHTHTLTGLRLSDFDATSTTSSSRSTGAPRGMGRRLLLPTQDGTNPNDGAYVSTLDALEGVDNLQTEFFVTHGRNFTEEELDDALDDAYIRATENDGANLRFEFDEDLLLEKDRMVVSHIRKGWEWQRPGQGWQR